MIQNMYNFLSFAKTMPYNAIVFMKRTSTVYAIAIANIK